MVIGGRLDVDDVVVDDVAVPSQPCDSMIHTFLDMSILL